MIATQQNAAAPDLAEAIATVAEHLRRITVQVVSRRAGSGSGVIWHFQTPAPSRFAAPSELPFLSGANTGRNFYAQASAGESWIVTNAHVAQSDRATVQLWDGRVFDAERVACDTERDLAALKIQAADLPAATPANSDALRVGELVLAMGNPRGIVGALTAGTVHAIATPEKPLSIHPNAAIANPSDWVIADIRLAPGNSGGPLADAIGRVIGINTAIAGGLALAVPSNAVDRFLREHLGRPRLGVTMRPVPVVLGNQHRCGLLILEIAFGSLAEAAGLAKGDVLVGACGQFFTTPEDLTGLLLHVSPGDLLPVEFLRNGKHHCCTVAPSRERVP